MTLSMADSIIPASLPAGYDAYLGYVDGEWATAAAVEAMFPGKPVLTLTVLGGTAVADGCDIESGDLTPEQGADWLAWRISEGASRPVGYAGVLNMASVLSALGTAKVQRAQVRLLSAHYGWTGTGGEQHICGPSTCGLVSVAMDGTQWTSSGTGVNGADIDESVLEDDFFTEETAVTIPGWPGQWYSYQFYAQPDGSVILVGQGTTGEVYWCKQPKGGTPSAPVVLSA